MAIEDAEAKTEQPTPRRRQEAREEGRIAQSADLTAALVLLGGLILLKVLGAGLLDTLLALTRGLGEARDLHPGSLSPALLHTVRAVATAAMPFLLLLIVLAAASALIQSGLLMTWKKLTPSLDKLDPVNGLRRLFALDALTRLGLGLLKMAIVAAVAYVTIRGQIGPLLACGLAPTEGFLHAAAELAYRLALRLGLALLILGLLDYFYHRFQHERSLRMTKQEVRDELKRMEGDPALKHRRRQVQMKLALQRIRRDVPKADVVVTNPTEYAVALKYDETTMAAPRLLAKGADYLAARIRQVAQEHGVPLVQRPPLARALYAGVEVGQEIPAAFYRAVAEVLAYVYQLTGKARRATA
jgi:flagellar biosynthesis protein FlhB